MFETAEVGRSLTKEEYEAGLPGIRAGLIQAQLALKRSVSPVIVVIHGVDGAGKGQVVHRLNEWLDPRGVETHAFWQLSDEDLERPLFFRFWRAMPSRGRIGLLFGAWYADVMRDRVSRRVKGAAYDNALRRIAFFERMLVEDGAVIVKLWFHLSRKAQRRRLKDLKDRPLTHWRVVPEDWKSGKVYRRFVEAGELAIRRTDAAGAPWFLIESEDERYRDLTAAKVLLRAMRQGLGGRPVKRKRGVGAVLPERIHRGAITLLDHVDLEKSLPADRYEKELESWQARLCRLAWKAQKKGRSTVMVFEGWDAAGKGSAIRRVTAALDARLYRVVPVMAPSDEEKAHHYLWRFWRQLPRAGRMTIFDRSWYGRVLVERVEGFATGGEWMRSYREINDFEQQLAEHGTVVVKFWLHIDREEQLKRFRKREKVAYKRHKITAEDWRNRERWEAYKEAVNDMVSRTSTGHAPWTIIPGNDKKFARVEVLKSVCGRLKEAL